MYIYVDLGDKCISAQQQQTEHQLKDDSLCEIIIFHFESMDLTTQCAKTNHSLKSLYFTLNPWI